MSFQAYIDNIQKKTGKLPEDFHKMAQEKGLTGPELTATRLAAWLKEDFDIGHGHAMAIWAVFKSKGWAEGGKAKAAKTRIDPPEALQVTTTPGHDYTHFLRANGRSADIPDEQDVYGWLVGSWDLECLYYNAAPVSLRGEAHFGWALEGRAVQDVWIMPALGERSSNSDRNTNMYGTTLRIWDPSVQGWRIYWRNPVHGHFEDQIGRWSGKDVVQEGVRADGTATRWTFTKIIRPDSFHWLGEALDPNGRTWQLEGEFRATRRRL